MATVLHSVTAAKPAACRDCGKAIGDRLVTWDCRCNACDDADQARKTLARILDSKDARAIGEAAAVLAAVETDAPLFREALRDSVFRLPALA